MATDKINDPLEQMHLMGKIEALLQLEMHIMNEKRKLEEQLSKLKKQL